MIWHLAYVHLGRDAEVIDQVNQIMTSGRSLSNKHQFLLEISQEYYHLALLENDIATYQKEIYILSQIVNDKESRHSAEATYNLARVYFKQNDFSKARAYYSRLIIDWPKSKYTSDAIVQKISCINELSEAGLLLNNNYVLDLEDSYQQLKNISPEVSTSDIELFIGEIKWKEKQWDDAVMYLEAFLTNAEESKKTSDVYYMLAKSHENLGDKLNAALYFESFIGKVNPEQDEAKWLEALQKINSLK